MTELNRMRHALAIVARGTFGAAANDLHISQSALTRSIQALEGEYGIQLFDRGRSGARLTPEGSRFMNRAEQLVRHVDAVDTNLRELSAGRDVAVSLGIGPISATLFLDSVLEEMLALSTEFPVRVKVASNSELRDMLQAGLLDFYVGGIPRDSAHAVHGLRIEPVRARSRVALLARTGHPLLTEIDDRDARSRYPVVAGSFAIDTSVGSDIERHGFSAPALVVDDYGLLVSLAQRTDALLLASELFVPMRRDLGLESLDVDLAAHADANYALVFPGAHRPSASVQRVADLIRTSVTAAFRLD